MRYLKIRKEKVILFLEIKNCTFNIVADDEKLKLDLTIMNLDTSANLTLTLIEAENEKGYWTFYNDIVERLNNWELGGEFSLTLPSYTSWSDEVWAEFNKRR